MKNLILSTIAVVSLFSCGQSPEDKVVEFAKSRMKDPGSFKLASVRVIDTMNKSDLILDEMLTVSNELSVWNAKINAALDKAQIWSGSYYFSHRAKRYTDEAKEYLDESKPFVTKGDSLKKALDNLRNTPQDSVIGHKWYVSYYAKNGFDKVVLQEMVVTQPINGPMTYTTDVSGKQANIEQERRISSAKLDVYR